MRIANLLLMQDKLPESDWSIINSINGNTKNRGVFAQMPEGMFCLYLCYVFACMYL